MNLPSLALPRSKFFQSRLGILVLALVAVLLGGAAFFALRPLAPPTLPTAATSPAAQAPVRAVPARPVPAPPKIVEVAPDTYGPLTPGMTWHTTSPAATAAAAASAAAPAPVGGASTANPAATAPLATGATALPAPAVPAVPGAPGAVAGAPAIETPKSLDASVLFQREQYTYTGDGRRDPFQSLLDGKFQGSGDGALVDVGDIHLVGIMWGAADKFALVEDSRGRGYVLRVGDPVVNGYISGISKTELQIVQNAFGESQSMSIKLQPKEGDQNATRN